VTSRRLSWLQTILSLTPWLLLVLLGSQRVVLAPPLTFHTATGYVLLWLLGSVLLGIDDWRRIGRRRRADWADLFVIVVIAIVMGFLLLGLFAPMSVASESDKCSTESLPDGNIRYVCLNSSGLFGVTYTLQGPSGLPFVRLVGVTFAND
jgi:hypothetical protein